MLCTAPHMPYHMVNRQGLVQTHRHQLLTSVPVHVSSSRPPSLTFALLAACASAARTEARAASSWVVSAASAAACDATTPATSSCVARRACA